MAVLLKARLERTGGQENLISAECRNLFLQMQFMPFCAKAYVTQLRLICFRKSRPNALLFTEFWLYMPMKVNSTTRHCHKPERRKKCPGNYEMGGNHFTVGKVCVFVSTCSLRLRMDFFSYVRPKR